MGVTKAQIEREAKLTKVYNVKPLNLKSNSNNDIEVNSSVGSSSMALNKDQQRRSSYRKLRMLPWCKDERDEIVHTEYIRFLAAMDSRQRSKAAKHAIVAASSLLRAKRSTTTTSSSKGAAGSKTETRK